MPWALKSAGYGGWYERSHSCFSSEIVSSIQQGEKRQRDMSERFARMKQASEWAEVSEWVEREYQNAPSLDFWDFYLMRLLSKSCTVIEKLCFPSMLWNNPHWWILRSFKSSQKMLSNAASPGLCSRMGFCKFISGICFRSRRTFRRLCLPSPIWTAFMFQTFCESCHIEMLFCQMHMTWIALQFTIQYNIRIYIYTYYKFTYNYIDASTTYVLYIHRYHNYTVIWIYPDSSVLWDACDSISQQLFFCQATGSNLCGSVGWSPLWCPWQGTQDLIAYPKKTLIWSYFQPKTTSTRLFPQQKKVQIKLHHVLSPPKRMSSHWGPDAMEPILQKLRPAKQAGQMVDGWCLEVEIL